MEPIVTPITDAMTQQEITRGPVSPAAQSVIDFENQMESAAEISPEQEAAFMEYFALNSAMLMLGIVTERDRVFAENMNEIESEMAKEPEKFHEDDEEESE